MAARCARSTASSSASVAPTNGRSAPRRGREAWLTAVKGATAAARLVDVLGPPRARCARPFAVRSLDVVGGRLLRLVRLPAHLISRAVASSGRTPEIAAESVGMWRAPPGIFVDPADEGRISPRSVRSAVRRRPEATHGVRGTADGTRVRCRLRRALDPRARSGTSAPRRSPRGSQGQEVRLETPSTAGPPIILVMSSHTGSRRELGKTLPIGTSASGTRLAGTRRASARPHGSTDERDPTPRRSTSDGGRLPVGRRDGRTVPGGPAVAGAGGTDPTAPIAGTRHRGTFSSRDERTSDRWVPTVGNVDRRTGASRSSEARLRWPARVAGCRDGARRGRRRSARGWCGRRRPARGRRRACRRR